MKKIKMWNMNSYTNYNNNKYKSYNNKFKIYKWIMILLIKIYKNIKKVIIFCLNRINIIKITEHKWLIRLKIIS